MAEPPDDEDEERPAIDPWRALAAAVVWRAIQDAFCGNQFTPNKGLCEGQESCLWCRAEAFDWLVSDAGQQMAELAEIDPDAMVAQLYRWRREGLRIQWRGKKVRWVSRT